MSGLKSIAILKVMISICFMAFLCVCKQYVVMEKAIITENGAPTIKQTLVHSSIWIRIIEKIAMFCVCLQIMLMYCLDLQCLNKSKFALSVWHVVGFCIFVQSNVGLIFYFVSVLTFLYVCIFHVLTFFMCRFQCSVGMYVGCTLRYFFL